MSEHNGTHWPVYMMDYRCSGVHKKLRIEWHHVPLTGNEVKDVVRCLRDYTNNPSDDQEYPNGETFKTLLPDYCIVQAGPHVTKTTTTERAPDTAYHISVRFGKLSTRAGSRPGVGYSVHIYLNDAKRYIPKKVLWGYPRPDKEQQFKVYKNRTLWPANADATKAPQAPEEHMQSSTSAPPIQELTPAPPPTTNAWTISRSPSPLPNSSQSGQLPGQGPFDGAPPSGRGGAG